MGRRDGTVDERVTIAVSPAMEKLRGLQRELNYFLYSTELSYGLALTGNDARLQNTTMAVSDALADVYASAWYPSNQGRIKYYTTVAGFLEQLERNARHVSRAIMVQWYSHVEEYLETRVRSLIMPKQNWGPLTKSLRCDALLSVPTPVRIATVLRAHFCREIRNLIVHGAPELPESYEAPDVLRWKRSRMDELGDSARSSGNAEGLVMDALHYVLGQAIDHKRATAREGRRENLEHFYTLFTFTNLDSLAFEIEEALLQTTALPDGRISRKATDVRRTDLVIRDLGAAAGQ
jgi:hypothetical protein